MHAPLLLLLAASSSAAALRPSPRLRLHQPSASTWRLVCSAEPPSDYVTIAAAGLVAQPVVWTSLYFVVTTGGGLPAGPFGLLGALEGLSYVAVLGLVGASAFNKVSTGSGLPPGRAGLLGAAEGLSYLTLVASLLALASLVVAKGCVPNAEPLLDYSAVLPVCKSDPGLFGL